MKSVVARDLKTRQDQEERRARQNAAASRTKDEIFNASEECLTVLKECLAIDEAASSKGVIVSASEVVRDLLVQCELASAQLAEILAVRSGDQKSKLTTALLLSSHVSLTYYSTFVAKAAALGNQLTAVLDRAKSLYNPSPRTPSKVSVAIPSPSSPISHSPNSHPTELDSPSFSIADSDDSESEDDETSSSSILGDLPSTPQISNRPSNLIMPDSIVLPNGSPSSPLSPLESQSRHLTLEEGEVFRRGAAVDVEDEELDTSGEDLRKEVGHSLE